MSGSLDDRVREADEHRIVLESVTDAEMPCLKPSHRDLEARLDALVRDRERLQRIEGEHASRGDTIDALFSVVNKHPELTAEVISALAAKSPDAALAVSSGGEETGE